MRLHWTDAVFTAFLIVGVICLVAGEKTLGIVSLVAAAVMLAATAIAMGKRGAERRKGLREGRSERAAENKPESD